MNALRRSEGMSLLECLGYVAVLAVVINLGASVFINASQLSALTTLSLDRLRAVDEVREAFVRTVHGSQGITDEIGTYRTDSQHIVLTCPPDPDSDGWRRYVVFGEITQAGLGRLEILAKGGELKVEAYTTYSLPVSAATFQADKNGLVTAQLDVPPASRTVSTKNPSPRQPVTYQFAAALRSQAK